MKLKSDARKSVCLITERDGEKVTEKGVSQKHRTTVTTV